MPNTAATSQPSKNAPNGSAARPSFAASLLGYLQGSEVLLLIAPTSLAIIASQGRGKTRQQRCLTHWQKDAPAVTQSGSHAQASLAEQLADIEVALREQLRALEGSAAATSATRIVLSDEWARYFIVTPANNTQSMADCMASAQMRFHTLFGEAPAAWQIQAAWQARQAFLACALPQALLTMLEKVCHAHARKIISVQTHLLATCTQFAKQIEANAWLLHFAEHSVQILALQHGQCKTVQSSYLPADFWQTPGSLQLLVQREALRWQVAAPSTITLAGQYARNWQTQVLATTQINALPGLTLQNNMSTSPALSMLHGVLA